PEAEAGSEQRERHQNDQGCQDSAGQDRGRIPEVRGTQIGPLAGRAGGARRHFHRSRIRGWCRRDPDRWPSVRLGGGERRRGRDPKLGRWIGRDLPGRGKRAAVGWRSPDRGREGREWWTAGWVDRVGGGSGLRVRTRGERWPAVRFGWRGRG